MTEANILHHYEGLVKALRIGGDTHGVEDVLAQIEKGEAKLWIAPDALIITEVHDAPRCRELRFWIATGDLPAVLELQEEVLAWGKEQGCTRAVFTGRRGWVKALRGSGWEEIMVVMGREL